MAVLQSRIDRMSDHRMRWCVHRAFRRWSFSSRTRTRLDSNSRVDDGFFFVFSVWTRRPRPTFPLFKLALRPGSTPDSSRHRSSISLPRNHVAFSFTKQVRFEHSIRSPSPIITLKREEKHPEKRQTNDQTKSFSAVRRRSVLVALIAIAASAAAPRLP